MNNADDEAIGADLDGRVLGALEGDGGFGNARNTDLSRRNGSKIEGFKFADSMRQSGGGIDHRSAERLIDHVNDEFLISADISRGIFGSFAVFIAWGEGDDGRIGAENVEEGKGGGIESAVFIEGGDPSDGARGDKRGEDFVTGRRREGFEIEGHLCER